MAQGDRAGVSRCVCVCARLHETHTHSLLQLVKWGNYNSERLDFICKPSLPDRASARRDNTRKVCVKCLHSYRFSMNTHTRSSSSSSSSSRRGHVDIQSGEFTPNCVWSQVAADRWQQMPATCVYTHTYKQAGTHTKTQKHTVHTA